MVSHGCSLSDVEHWTLSSWQCSKLYPAQELAMRIEES
jgi:hypothetical protein